MPSSHAAIDVVFSIDQHNLETANKSPCAFVAKISAFGGVILNDPTVLL